jgi:thiol:disulfide interchange protein DsbD
VGTLLIAGALAIVVAGRAVAADDFLPPEQAFRYTVESDGERVLVRWNVARGYYLYKSRMGLAGETPGIEVGESSYPRGEIHSDEYFGEQEVFRGAFTVEAPLTRSSPAVRDLALALKLQGCADAGLCYPPTIWNAKVALHTAAANLDAIFDAARVQSNEDEFLPPEQAFRLSAVAEGPDRVRLDWQIADGYYLYKGRLGVKTASERAALGAPRLPEGKFHEDEYFGRQEVYYGRLVASVPVSRPAGAGFDLPIDVTYQGCADAGLCYPPITTTLTIAMPAGDASAAASSGGFVSEQDRLAKLIASGNLFIVLGTFFGLGLLLAFTPCVLPMVPILSGIIAGQGENTTTARAFSLSLTYVLGMAFTYTIAGAAFAAAGQQVQAVFQQPWIVTIFAGLFVVLALSMFGAFNVQMPAFVQTTLASLSNRQRAGSFGGVAVMGALSALIVTTCVAPPLIATLTVIGQSGDMVRGAAALFAMSLGMGAPLLAVGASAGKLLPRAGPWMDTIKRFFGVLMLAVAAWMLSRIVPERLILVLWAVPALLAAWVLWSAVTRTPAANVALRAGSVAAGLYGLLLVAGAAVGGTDPLAPLPRLAGKHAELPFTSIKSVADLEREVAAAKLASRPVMLDFYADWCVSCKEMEKYTFTDPDVQAALSGALLLQADVTKNDALDQALLKHFGIFGPPTIAFYGPDGIERRNYRVVGYMEAGKFAPLAREAIAAR